jgi:phosphate transport system substrate-binding protein
MKSLKRMAALGLLAAAAAACGPQQGGGDRGGGVFTVIVDGSSTVFPIAEAAAAGFQAETGGRVRVTVAESGTGGGFKKFCRGETHVQGASRPITAGEMAACRESGVTYVEIPIAFDALSVVVHPSSPVQSLTVAQLKKLWEPSAQGKITNWRDVDPALGDKPIALFGPGTASGTFDYFTEAVMGEAKSSRSDFTPSEDDNLLVQGVAGNEGGLGYFGMAYYLENKSKVRAVGVDSGNGPVLPSAETVKSGAYQPLSRPIFVYFNAAALDRKPVLEFVTHFINEAPAYAESVAYVPLPAEAYAQALQRVTERRTGTVFGGVAEIGASIEEIMSREASDLAKGDAPAPAPTPAP